MTEAGEWERQADRAAECLGAEIDNLEACWPGPSESFRPFWARVKDLNERVRTAPAIKLDDKLSLQHRVNELCHRARGEQRDRAEQMRALETEINQALDLADENLREARTIETVQAVRADLNVLRTRIESSSAHLRRSDSWERWQAINHAAWSRLNELWADNEKLLSTMLEDAESLVARSDARAAKDAVKQFHAVAADLACSHRALKNLRERAHRIWGKADEIGREKHERFLQQASGRVVRWRDAQARRSRQRQSVEREITSLELQLDRASTGVGHALLRGQIEERKKALAALDAETQDLQRQIDEAEQELARG